MSEQIPSLIRVIRESDFVDFAKVGEPILIQGTNFSCIELILFDTETPSNTIIDSETPLNTIINSTGIS